MIFREDFDINVDENGKVKKEEIEKLYKEFCKNYVDQIKNKLDFDCVFVEITKNKKEDQLNKINPTTLRKKLESNEEIVKKMIRFEMRMVNSVNRISKEERKKKPKISRPEQDKKRAEEKRKKNESRKKRGEQ